MGTEVEETNAGDHLMGATLKLRQHAVRVGQVAGLAENIEIQKNERVGAQDDGVGDFFPHGTGFMMGIEEANFSGRQVFRSDLDRVAGNDLEIRRYLAKEFSPAGRR